jgi:AcrR family transcriptional regulator
MTDRREQILTEAARLFRVHGYHGVGVDDIGAAAGITGPAIYRHFRGKQELLVASVERMVEILSEESVSMTDGSPPSLSDLSKATVRLCLEHRDLMAVYTGGVRLLPQPLRNRVAKQQARFARVWHRALGAVHEGISHQEVEARISSALGIALLPLSYDTPNEGGDHGSHLVAMTLAALRAQIEGDRELPPPRYIPTVRGAARRDRVLTEAIKLFREQGYAAVSVEAIGAAAGLDQSSVYRHYANKDDILLAGLLAGADALEASVAAIERDAPPDRRLDWLVGGYVDAALVNRDLISVWVTESSHLTGPSSKRVRQRQRAYIDVWANALQSGGTGLDARAAHLATRSVFALVNAGVSRRPQRGWPDGRLRELLLAMSHATLDEALAGFTSKEAV